MRKYIYLVLLLAICLFLLFVVSLPDNDLHIVACDVGQGDAILFQKSNIQILIDGGPDSKVLQCLSKYMPFWDRTIELVILTHPQTDHFTGLIDVFRRYSIDALLANSVDASSGSYQVLKKDIRGMNLKLVNPKTFMKINLNDIKISLLNPPELSDHPNQNVLGAFTTKEDLNNFSIVSRFDYKNFTALTTGDMGPNITGRVMETGLIKNITYLKVPHHGSKNGLTKEFLDLINPRVAVISVGAKNHYGHPSPEVIDMLRKANVITKRTDLDHSIHFVTDGEKWWFKP